MRRLSAVLWLGLLLAFTLAACAPKAPGGKPSWEGAPTTDTPTPPPTTPASTAAAEAAENLPTPAASEGASLDHGGMGAAAAENLPGQ